jgi:hypothetical protein
VAEGERELNRERKQRNKRTRSQTRSKPMHLTLRTPRKRLDSPSIDLSYTITFLQWATLRLIGTVARKHRTNNIIKGALVAPSRAIHSVEFLPRKGLRSVAWGSATSFFCCATYVGS